MQKIFKFKNYSRSSAFGCLLLRKSSFSGNSADRDLRQLISLLFFIIDDV